MRAPLRYLALAFAALLLALPLHAAEGEVRVTGTAYDDYARLVFNVPLDGAFDVAISGDKLIITLSSPLQPSFREALGPLRDYIASATVQGGKQVIFKLKRKDVKFRKFRSAGYFGVDIIPLAKTEAAKAPAPKPKESKKPETAAAPEAAGKAPRPRGRPSSIPQETESAVPAAKPAKETAKKPEEKPAKPEPVKQVPVAKVEKPAPAPAAAQTAQAGSGDELVRVAFKERVPAAIYQRGSTLWAVFGKPTLQDVGPMVKGAITSAKQLPDRHGTIIKLGLRSDVKPESLWVSRDGFDWVVRSGKPAVVTPLAINTKLGESPEVRIDVLQAGDPLNFTDPDIGDELFIVPVRDPGNFVNPARRFVDMQVLPSLQGVVIRRVSEEARYKVERDGIRVSALRGLMASEVFTREEPLVEEKKPEGEIAPPTELTRVSMFPFLANPQAADFMPGYYNTLQSLVENTEGSRSEKQMQMAQFLFEQELYPEALGVLRQILEDDPEFSRGEHVRDMIAASQFLMGRYDQAEEAFGALVASDRNMEFKDEQKLWQWMSNQMNAHENLIPAATAEIGFDSAAVFAKYMSAYPLALRRKFALIEAEYVLGDSRTGVARQFLEMVEKLSPTQDDRDTMAYLHARLYEIERKDDMAIDGYKKLIENAGSGRTRAASALALAKFLRETGKAPLKESIALLERARPDWRGDRLEADILRTLGQYYIDDKQYVEGLRAWRALVSNYSGTTTALEVAGEMAKIYAGLFESADAEKMSSVQALGLFFEFNELMPVGVAGDRISRKLAEHLESVDLLESAAAILTHQVRYRSQGPERAGLAAKLVQLHLANNRTDLASEVLEAMAKENIPENLMAHYRYLRAETLVRGGKYDAALTLITGDNTPEARDLKFAIYWYQQQWERIVDILEPDIKARAGNKDTLTADEEERVLRLAVAYSRLRRWNEMKWLKTAYDGRLKSAEVDEAFDFITERSASVDYTKLDATTELDKLESFLKVYRKPEPEPAPAPAEPAAPPAAEPAAPAPAEGAAPEAAPKEEPKAEAPAAAEPPAKQ